MPRHYFRISGNYQEILLNVLVFKPPGEAHFAEGKRIATQSAQSRKCLQSRNFVVTGFLYYVWRGMELNQKEAKIIRVAGILLFILYIILLMYLLFFAENFGRTVVDRKYSYNLILFKEIYRFIKYRKELGLLPVLVNLGGNIVAFIPFGCILPIISKKRRKFFIILLLSFELSLAIEITQLISKVGSFDVDDMLLNTVGGAIGYVVYAMTNRLRRKYYG